MSANVINAVYCDTGVHDYNGNPFIEALPPLKDPVKAVSALRTMRTVELSDLQAPRSVRSQNISGILDNFFQPLSVHVRLRERISIMIRRGYVGRNPQTGDYQSHLQNGYERVQTGELDSFRFDAAKSTAQSLLLSGCSGSGKTTSLNRILDEYAQVIYHQILNIQQVVYLKIDCSHNGSLKEICLNFFRAIDRVLGSNYEKRYGLKRFGIETMLALMAQVANAHALGLLVIDEIQHLSRSKSGISQAMLNFFVTMVNTIGVPIMLIGTPKARDIFEGDLRSARRGAGLGAIYWEPLVANDPKLKQEWIGFTNNLWKLQFLQGRDSLLSDEIRKTWYDLSQGVIDIVVKLFVLAQLRALSLQKEQISSGLLRQVYDDELKPVHPMLDALRSGIPERIARYSDLVLPDIDKRLIEMRLDISSIQDKTSDDLALEKLSFDNEKRIYMMLKDDYESGLLVDVIQDVCKSYSELSRQQHLKIIVNQLSKTDESGSISILDSNQKKNKIIKVEDWHTLPHDDLRYLYSKYKTADKIYAAMKEIGLVFDLKRFYG
jgi:hypothetical protein